MREVVVYHHDVLLLPFWSSYVQKYVKEAVSQLHTEHFGMIKGEESKRLPASQAL